MFLWNFLISKCWQQPETSLFKACASQIKHLCGLHLAHGCKLVTVDSSKPPTILAPDGLGPRIDICGMVGSTEVALCCYHSMRRLETSLELGLGNSTGGL